MASSQTNIIKLHQQLEDITKCCICSETFTDPRILPCVHTFCLKCLEDLASKSKKKAGQYTQCPLCKREFLIPLEGFTGIQKNFYLAKHIEIGRSMGRSSSRQVCGACLEDGFDATSATQAPLTEMFCTVCCTLLCENCLKIHRTCKLTKSHKLKTVETQSMLGENQCKLISEFCSVHESDLLKMYCSDCKKLVCSFCYIESHQGHKWSDIEKASDQFCTQIQNHVQSVALKNKELKVKKKKSSQSKLDVIASFQNLELEINQRKALLKETIDKHANLLLMEIKALHQENLRAVQTEEEDIDMQIADVEYYTLYCQEIIAKGSAGDVCRSEAQLRKWASSLGNVNESICQRHFQPFCVILTVSKLDEFLKDNGENIIGKIEG